MKRLYVHEKEVAETLSRITVEQAKSKIFLSVRVKPYRGNKYSKDTKVIIIG